MKNPFKQENKLKKENKITKNYIPSKFPLDKIKSIEDLNLIN